MLPIIKKYWNIKQHIPSKAKHLSAFHWMRVLSRVIKENIRGITVARMGLRMGCLLLGENHLFIKRLLSKLGSSKNKDLLGKKIKLTALIISILISSKGKRRLSTGSSTILYTASTASFREFRNAFISNSHMPLSYPHCFIRPLSSPHLSIKWWSPALPPHLTATWHSPKSSKKLPFHPRALTMGEKPVWRQHFTVLRPANSLLGPSTAG